MMTYFISAFWHGLYPGFFIFSMSIPLLTNIERLVRAKINPLVVPEYDGKNLSTYPATPVGYAYWGLCVFCTFISTSYLVQVHIAVNVYICNTMTTDCGLIDMCVLCGTGILH